MRIIGLAGWSGSGKTTLLTKLIPCLTARGKRVSTLKHAHHAFDVDRPGKDSFEHRSAGATEVLVVSGNRWALMHELRGAPEPPLRDMLAKLSKVDLVLVEGFKRESFPKLEVHRAAIVAVATDTPLPDVELPVVGLNDIDAIADLLLAQAIPIASVKEHADAL